METTLNQRDESFARGARYRVSHPDGDGASSTVALSASLESALYDAQHLRQPSHDYSNNCVYDRVEKKTLYVIYTHVEECQRRKGMKYENLGCEEEKQDGWGDPIWLPWLG